MADRGVAFLLAPGAGAPSSHPRMQTFARLLASIGPVEPFDYLYAKEGRKRPDPPPKLIAAHKAALASFREKHDGPIVLVGKSMGGRIGCHVALVSRSQPWSALATRFAPPATHQSCATKSYWSCERRRCSFRERGTLSAHLTRTCANASPLDGNQIQLHTAL
jgi:hypothetical protein